MTVGDLVSTHWFVLFQEFLRQEIEERRLGLETVRSLEELEHLQTELKLLRYLHDLPENSAEKKRVIG